MATASRVIRNTGWLYLKMGISIFVSFYTTRVILQTLGASDFGVYNIVGGAIAMLGFINSSMASSTQRFMSYAAGQKQIDKQKAIFNISCVIHLILAIVTLIILIIAGYILFNGILVIPQGRINAAVIVYGCLAVSNFISMISVPYDAVLNAHENMFYYSIVGIIESFFKLLVAFLVTISPIDKLVYYGFLMVIVALIIRIIMQVYCYRHYDECKYDFINSWDYKLAKEMSSFAGWGVISSIAALFTMQGMSILLNIFGGVVVNAAHGVATQLAGQLISFSNNMLKALNPVLVKRRGAGENDKMLEAASTGSKMSFLIYSFFAVPFIVEAPQILDLWLDTPPKWAVLFVRLVLIRQMVSQLYITLETCISAVGKIKEITIINTMIWGFPIVVGYIFYRQGAPIYTIYLLLIIMNIFRMINTLYYSNSLCSLNIWKYIRHTVIPCSIETVLLFGLLLLLGVMITSSIQRLVLVLVVSTIFHLAMSYTMCFDDKEKSIVKSMFRKFI